MAKNKLPDKEERDPLSLLTQKILFYTQKLFKPLAFILPAGLVGLAGFFLYSHQQKKTNNKAMELLYQSKKKLIRAEQKAGGDTLSFDHSQNFFGQAKKAEYNKELEGQAESHIALIEKWISKPAGLSAGMETAHFLYQYGKQEQAVKLLGRADKKKDLTGFLTAFQLGVYLMEQGKYDKALENFAFITEEKKAKWLWPEALLKTALSLEKQNKTVKAREVYKTIKKEFPDSPVSDTAGQYLNALNVMQKIKARGRDFKKKTSSAPNGLKNNTKPVKIEP